MKKYISTQTYWLNSVGLCFIVTNDESQSRENLCKSLIGEFVTNAVKYIVRAGIKNKEKEIEDLYKAIWYINREIQCLQKQNPPKTTTK